MNYYLFNKEKKKYFIFNIKFFVKLILVLILLY